MIFLFFTDKPVASVDVEVVPCTKVSMDLFDPIYTCGIVAPSGHIARCLHEVYPDYDKLREVRLPFCFTVFVFVFVFYRPPSKQMFLCACRCCWMRTQRTTTYWGVPNERSCCFASSSTFASEER